MGTEADNSRREAVGSGVVGEVDEWVVGETGEDVAVLGKPPIVVIEDNKDHLSVEMLGGDVERENAVVEIVVDVAGVSAGGEDDGWEAMTDLTRGECILLGGGDDAETGDGVHDGGLPFPGIGFNLLLLGRGGDEGDGGGGGVSPDVAASEIADVCVECRPIAADGVGGD